MRVRVVPREELSRFSGEAWVDRKRRPYVQEREAFVPVLDGHPADCEIPEKKPYHGRGYQMLGDTALVHGTRPTDDEISEIVRWRQPRCVIYLGGHTGVTRIPEAEVLYGTAGEVSHHENGITYFLDPCRVMFSQGNREEKARIAGLIREGEHVADMFAGIGYFTISAARAGAQVHAMEINPVAFSYLEKNCAANYVAGQVRCSCGDCRDLLDGTYDRILMGHFDSVSMLRSAFSHVHVGSVLHVHTIGHAVDEISLEAERAGWQIGLTEVKVKKYAPGRWHMVTDVVIEG